MIQPLSLSGQLIALAPLVKLTVLDLAGTNVEGDVAGLAPLVKLTKLNLNSTKVEGDHEKLKAIQAERAAASP